jgi:hypothetical protein
VIACPAIGGDNASLDSNYGFRSIMVHISIPFLGSFACSLLGIYAAQIASPSDQQFSDQSEIVVTGKAPKIAAGRWLVEKGSTFPVKFSRIAKPIRGRKYEACLQSSDLEPALRLILDDNKQIDVYDRCARMNLQFLYRKITGDMVCRVGSTTIKKSVRGSFSDDTVDVTVTSIFESYGRPSSSHRYRTQISAHRMGDCL